MEQEKWIQEILKSTNGITKISPSDDLFTKIEQRIQSKTVSIRTLWLVAASIIMLISLNLSLIYASKTLNNKVNSSLENTLNKNNQLYY